jgi:hypothetical protein
MILIDFDKLTELSNVLIQYKSVLENNLDMAIKQGNNWAFSRQQFAKCPPLVQLEDDYRTLRKKREKILSDIDKTISCINYVISVYRGTEMAIAGLANQIIERNGLVTNTNKYLSMFKDIGECVADGVGGINEITDDIVEVIKEEDSDTDNTDDNTDDKTASDNNENSTSLNGELFYNQFLAKCARDDYKSDEKKYDVGGWQSFWDDTTPLSDYMIFGHKVPVIPSSSDIVGCGLKKLFANNVLFNSDLFDGVVSSSALSFLGTIVGHTDSIQKKLAGIVDKDDLITNIYGDNISATSAPYTRVAKISGNIANTMSIGFMCADIGNTWTEDNGNTRLQRVEKTVIQGVGDGICYETGKGTEAMAVTGFATLPDGGGALVVTAGAIDVTVSTGVNYVEDKTYNWLGIK